MFHILRTRTEKRWTSSDLWDRSSSMMEFRKGGICAKACMMTLK